MFIHFDNDGKVDNFSSVLDKSPKLIGVKLRKEDEGVAMEKIAPVFNNNGVIVDYKIDDES